MVATKECGLTASLICFTERNWRFESHFCETKNVSSTDGQLTICIAKRLRMWLTKMAGTRDPPERCQRPSSESAPTTMLPIPTATPNRDRPADTMVCFHRTTTEALRRARSASEKTQLNYKGRTNCYKVIISSLAEVTLSVIRILKPKVSVAYAYWQRTNSIIMKTYTNIMNEKKMYSFEYIDACLSIDYVMKNM